MIDIPIRLLLVGIGATLVMDLRALILQRLFGASSLDYALVGRWVGLMPSGRFRHATIHTAARVNGERTIGWCVHYAIGVLFAALLVLFTGVQWLYQPTFRPALAMGILSVVAPFFIMQPALGFGIAAAKTPKPQAARLRSFMTHTTFGVGLYVAAVVADWLLQ
ncbi:DUF2938 domain-containing protein [Brenneria populi]|uniref:DUF2938 domain-containing protein n=1 Tax=Brenneria populi TaxID=1505588 RepID=A0ABU6JRX7_9GAMM|nr:DUF2938 domain-containing protein [Brenneria populi Li et al. 2015]